MKTASRVCKDHWTPKAHDKGCGKCPIRGACHAPIGRLTQESLDDWRERVEDQAERVREVTG